MSNDKYSDISYPGKEKWMSVLNGALENGELNTEVANAVKKAQAGGKRRKAGSRKVAAKKAPSKKGSRKGSRKGSKKGSKKAQAGGAKKASRKASKKAPSKKGSRSSRKQSRGGAPPASAREALTAFRGLVKHIADTMNIPAGPVAMTAASYYKKDAEAKKGAIGTLELIKEATKLFDADSESNRKANIKKAQDHLVAKRAERKAKKQTGGGAPSYSETSDF